MKKYMYDIINCLLILSTFFDLISTTDSPVDLTSGSRSTRSKIQFQENMLNLGWERGACMVTNKKDFFYV